MGTATAIREPLHLSHDLEGLHFKKRQSLSLRNWYQRQVDDYTQRKAKGKNGEWCGLEPVEFYRNTYSLSGAVDDHCEKMAQANNHDWECSVDIKRLLKDYNGQMNVVTGTSWGSDGYFWQGILSYDPWYELKMSEDSIIETILRHHVFYDADANIFFDWNPVSPLNHWLKHQWGIENDVSVNVHTIVRRVLQGIMEVLNKDDDRYPKYHKWVQSGHCPKCDAWMCSPTGHCFECETELTYE